MCSETVAVLTFQAWGALFGHELSLPGHRRDVYVASGSGEIGFNMRKALAVLGSALFFVVAPGTVATARLLEYGRSGETLKDSIIRSLESDRTASVFANDILQVSRGVRPAVCWHGRAGLSSR